MLEGFHEFLVCSMFLVIFELFDELLAFSRVKEFIRAEQARRSRVSWVKSWISRAIVILLSLFRNGVD